MVLGDKRCDASALPGPVVHAALHVVLSVALLQAYVEFDSLLVVV